MFRFFRRYQKSFIVVGGVILMFVFLVGDYIGRGSDPAGTGSQISPNATFATWKGGSLTHAEFDAEYNKRQILNVFLQTVYTMGETRAMASGLEIPSLTVQPIGFLNQREGRSADQVRWEVLLDKILADQARKRGMGVSRETLEAYVAKLGFSELSSEDLRAALSSIRAPVSSDYVLNALEDAFLAHIMRGVYGTSAAGMLATEMPLDRWRAWRQVHDLVAIEAAALKVDDFVSQVPAPTEQQLRGLYDEFKDAIPVPDLVGGVRLPSPSPAFAIPRKVKLQYLQADFNGLVEKLKGEVTDEEVKNYYEENKGLFRKASPLDLFGPLPEAEEEGTTDGTTPEGETPAPPAGEEEATSPEPAAEDAPAETAADESPAPEQEPEAPATEAPAEAAEAPAESSAEPAGEPSTDGTSSENEPAGEEPSADEPASEPQALRAQVGKVEFVSFLQEGEETPSTEEPATEEPATEQPATEQPAADGPTADGSASQDEPATEDQPSEGEEGPGAAEEPATESPAEEETSGEPSAEGQATEGQTPEDEPAGEKEEELSPLEEVADQIREQIARGRADEQLGPALDAALERLQISAREYRRKVLALPEDEPRPAPPADLADLGALAAEFNLVYEETEPVDYFELLDTEIGKAVDDQFQRVVQLVFSESTTDLYRPFTAMSMTPESFGNRFIVMKIADTPRRVPPYDEVKSAVREAWIRREAAKLAKQRAEEFAAKASEAGQSLKEFFAGDEKVEVTETPAFSWFTQGEAASPEQGPNYRMSQPFGVNNVGRDFMEAVFNLRGNDVKAALNHDESVAYVVRIASEIETEESLRSNFLANANGWEGRLPFRQATLQDRQFTISNTLEEQLDIEAPGIEEMSKPRQQ